MKLEDKVVPRCITLTGFNNAIERTSIEITLSVLAGSVTLETTFHIMDQDTTYNAIIGRPWIHSMRTIPSSLYQIIKFPPPWGIFIIQEEQRTSRECCCIALDCTTTQQMKGKAKEAYQLTGSRSSCGEKEDVIKEPETVEAVESTIEDLDQVQLDDNDHNKRAYVSCKLQEADMPGIPKEISTHKLNIDSLHPPVRQVRRKFNSAINDAVREEVENLLQNGSIRESKYP
ncbi:PREDICTED: uncharacterized protein LOC109230288 [Nicotiana attenuata]|uniref:uncharacterized protein LOC109230288 n=1 Tax=Nicotiana attenuata TaxID=49451 RepID=UPI000904A7DA|nr:PREDICTED: uncharacterized protein LOC109230288 [Nicotiana attenuata]